MNTEHVIDYGQYGQHQWTDGLGNTGFGNYPSPSPNPNAPWIETDEAFNARRKRFQQEQADALKKGFKNPPNKPTQAAPGKALRTFESGATRDSAEGKNEYGGFLSPLVLEEYGNYMTEHRVQSDGSLRDSDNWKKGIPQRAYFESLLRHVMDFWKLQFGHSVKPEMRGGVSKLPTKKSLLCSIMFNTMGYLHTLLVEDEKAQAA